MCLRYPLFGLDNWWFSPPDFSCSGCYTNVCRNVGAPRSESVPLASEWQQCFYFGRPASCQQPTQGKNMHTRSPLLPVAARAPFRHPISPADTIHQRPQKSNAANWKVMTAKGLLDLHANSSILASYSQTTGKMRLCTSFQTFSCLLLHSTRAYAHIYFLLGFAVLKPKINWRLHYMCFPKSWPRIARGNMFLSSC